MIRPKGVTLVRVEIHVEVLYKITLVSKVVGLILKEVENCILHTLGPIGGAEVDVELAGEEPFELSSSAPSYLVDSLGGDDEDEGSGQQD